VIEWLSRVIPVPDEPPVDLPQKEAMQRVTHQTAFEPETWTPERAAKVAELFDSMADSWNTRQTSVSRYDALHDAIARGDVPRGRCLEIGSGTGLATPILAAHFDRVISLDLSHEMLVRAKGCRVEADAARLPFVDATFDAVVLVNALLFPRELQRVTNTVVWVNTRGADTPIHLPPEDVAAAMSWKGVAAEAGPGVWAVVTSS
jgi:SAM-dependent methyltransferase